MIDPKEAAEDYANLQVWINKEERPDPEFHEYIAKTAWLEGYNAREKSVSMEDAKALIEIINALFPYPKLSVSKQRIEHNIRRFKSKYPDL